MQASRRHYVPPSSYGFFNSERNATHHLTLIFPVSIALASNEKLDLIGLSMLCDLSFVECSYFKDHASNLSFISMP